MKVSLRERVGKTKISIMLVYYEKGGKREYETLDIFLWPTPKKGSLTTAQKDENKKNRALSEAIRAKKQLQIQSGNYGFNDRLQLKQSFIEYFKSLRDQRINGEGSYSNWNATLMHVNKCFPDGFTFEQLTPKIVTEFKYYLENTAVNTGGKPLSPNTQHAYFNRFRSATRQAAIDDIIPKNPSDGSKGIKTQEAPREYLTFNELKKMISTECDYPVLKQAFLFGCLTGLRWSDISKLDWEDLRVDDEGSHEVRFRQQKTKGFEYLPISPDALKFMGQQKDTGRVFRELKYSSQISDRIQKWARKAGIIKDITFHSSRHTLAILLLNKGVDIYTVSKMLGHQELKTTQIYAKLMNPAKRKAANVIRLDL